MTNQPRKSQLKAWQEGLTLTAHPGGKIERVLALHAVCTSTTKSQSRASRLITHRNHVDRPERPVLRVCPSPVPVISHYCKSDHAPSQRLPRQVRRDFANSPIARRRQQPLLPCARYACSRRSNNALERHIVFTFKTLTTCVARQGPHQGQWPTSQPS